MIINADFCIDCKLCELACSFHHKNIFNPEISSIKILDCLRENIRIKIYEKKEQGDINIKCDHCCGLEEEMCVKYCPMGMNLKKILEESKR